MSVTADRWRGCSRGQPPNSATNCSRLMVWGRRPRTRFCCMPEIIRSLWWMLIRGAFWNGTEIVSSAAGYEEIRLLFESALAGQTRPGPAQAELGRASLTVTWRWAREASCHRPSRVSIGLTRKRSGPGFQRNARVDRRSRQELLPKVTTASVSNVLCRSSFLRQSESA